MRRKVIAYLLCGKPLVFLQVLWGFLFRTAHRTLARNRRFRVA